MDPAARIDVGSDNVVDRVHAKSCGSYGARRIEGCIHAPDQQKSVYGTRHG
jgi:hypothetical protein